MVVKGDCYNPIMGFGIGDSVRINRECLNITKKWNDDDCFEVVGISMNSNALLIKTKMGWRLDLRDLETDNLYYIGEKYIEEKASCWAICVDDVVEIIDKNGFWRA